MHANEMRRTAAHHVQVRAAHHVQVRVGAPCATSRAGGPHTSKSSGMCRDVTFSVKIPVGLRLSASIRMKAGTHHVEDPQNEHIDQHFGGGVNSSRLSSFSRGQQQSRASYLLGNGVRREGVLGGRSKPTRFSFRATGTTRVGESSRPVQSMVGRLSTLCVRRTARASLWRTSSHEVSAEGECGRTRTSPSRTHERRRVRSLGCEGASTRCSMSREEVRRRGSLRLDFPSCSSDVFSEVAQAVLTCIEHGASNWTTYWQQQAVDAPIERTRGATT